MDGELVAVDASGHPPSRRYSTVNCIPATSRVLRVDLLHLNGVDFTRRPLEERRASLPAGRESVSGILLSEALSGSVAQITEALRGLGLEGVIAKRKTSRYDAGARADAC